MQALQSLANSLQDPLALQRLQRHLQELPRRLLEWHSGPEDYLLGSVSGDFNFHFSFRLEGGGFFQTGVLIAAAERGGPGGLPVPLKCVWLRRVGDVEVIIPGLNSNMYQISADDVGTDIIVKAQPADNEDGFFGVAVGEIGPFELDLSTRRSLDNALGRGECRFSPVQTRDPNGTAESAGSQEVSVSVTADEVRVINSIDCRGRELSADYSGDYPKVIIHPLNTLKFTLEMSETRCLHLIAPSRSERDLVALTIRCFHVKKHVSMTAVLRHLLPVQPLSAGSGPPPAGPPDGRLDACIVLERLVREMNRSMQQKEVTEKMLRNTTVEKRQLQEQLLETITGFTEVIEGLNDQIAEGGSQPSGVPPASVEKVQEQLREFAEGARAQQAERRAAQEELAALAAAREAHARQTEQRGGGGPAHEVKQLREERQFLQARLTELTAAPARGRQHPDDVEQAHVKELKRLRQDVEALHSDKENLRQQLQEKDHEREELQQNFLYVKGQLDKVQMKQAQAQTGGGSSAAHELRRHEQSVHCVGEERNRLSMRLEAFMNEAEKEKTYHEQSLDRVMTANGKLLEEKDRAAREVQRLSALYAEAIAQLKQEDVDTTRSLDVQRTDTMADDDCVAKLREEVAAADAMLSKREEENESLKSRIRKLAVA